jgi:KaiC/GvpD/RAD55 family RecA-like ATPase
MIEVPPDVPIAKRIAACSSFIGALGELSEFGYEWLSKERGLDPDTVRGFRFADVHEKNATEALGAAIRATDVQTCLSLGLAGESSSSDRLFCPVGFAYHLAIPYLTDTGSVAHIQFRRISRSGKPSGPKYIHLRGAVPIPFNLPTTTSLPVTEDGNERVFLVEGALDAVALSQQGLGALGIPGVGWLNKNRAERLLKRLAGDTELVVAFDSDDAGRKATEKVVKFFSDLGTRALRVDWPQGFDGDWCDWIREKPDSAPDVVGEPLSDTELWIGDVMKAGTADIVAVASGSKVSTQVKTGYPLMDSILEIQPGDMVVVAARPSTGKSHFVLSVMQRMAKRFGTKSLFVSLEMSKMSVAQRISKAQMGIGQKTKMQIEDLEYAADLANQSFKELPILIDFGSRDLDRVVSYARAAVKKHNIELVVVDYLQLLETKGRSRQEEVAKSSRAVKALANELLVPVVAVVQMNREIEKRSGNMPQMSDLRESGQIEQDADAIIFVDRPYNHNPNANFSDFNVRVAKQRNGSPGRLTMHLPEPFGWLADREFDVREPIL